VNVEGSTPFAYLSDLADPADAPIASFP
jgi:hypothetical protein